MMTCHFKLNKEQLEAILLLSNDKRVAFTGKNRLTFFNLAPIPLSISFISNVENPEFHSCLSTHNTFWERLSHVDKEVEIEIGEKSIKATTSDIIIRSSIIKEPYDDNNNIIPEDSAVISDLKIGSAISISEMAQRVLASSDIQLMLFNDSTVYMATKYVVAVRNIEEENFDLRQVVDLSCFQKAVNIARVMNTDFQIVKTGDKGDKIYYQGKNSSNENFLMSALSTYNDLFPTETVSDLAERFLLKAVTSDKFVHLDGVEVNKFLSFYKRDEKIIFDSKGSKSFFENTEEQKCTSKMGCIKSGDSFILGFTKANFIIPKAREIRIDYFEPGDPFLIRPFPFRGEAYLIAPLRLDETDKISLD